MTNPQQFPLSQVASDALMEPGPLLVTGGPGSGKTTLALLKARRLAADLHAGQQILFLSFSRAAVRQVLARCKDVLSASERDQITVRTYHSFCLDVLRAHGRLLTGLPATVLFPSKERLQRSNFDGDWTAESRRLAAQEGVFTFDMFADSTSELLRRSRAVRELVADQYPVAILDEFQDTNDAQWVLVEQLSRGSRLIVLADPDQRIFDYDSTVDPRRLEQLTASMAVAHFNLGSTNHRSPNSEILSFADAVLNARSLPRTENVVLLHYRSREFDSKVHAVVSHLRDNLASNGIDAPSIAVLCRSNSLVPDLSRAIGATHTWNGQAIAAIEHAVSWDPELSAAAARVVASILEWSGSEPEAAVIGSLQEIGNYFRMKHAIKVNKSAHKKSDTALRAAEAIATGKTPRSKAGKHLLDAVSQGLTFDGRPVEDWLTARHALIGADDLKEIYANVRFVRMFKATDDIATLLSGLWTDQGSYAGARERISRILDLGSLDGQKQEDSGCSLMTMHKSKGREFDGVVLVEGEYKAKFFDNEPPPYQSSRRLLRVGITRARHQVVIMRPTGAVPHF